MPDPTIPALLRAAFEIERKLSEEDLFTLDWPDDSEGQASCIRHLASLATVSPWAYDKLVEIARDYREKGEPCSVPPEMGSWCFGVVSGQFERPQRKRGRPGAQYAVCDRFIFLVVEWLRERGATREDAIKQVAEATRLLPKRVDEILTKAANSSWPADAAKKYLIYPG
ncbi:MAG: hypothetical protein OXG37_01875 [Actinomycetia bacterium]|nr:hypothetical protein [Actinomycetes bacterium]